MTAFARTQFPTNINTVEKFLVHAATLLERLNPALTQTEDQNIVEKAVQIVTKMNPDGVPIMIIRVTLPLNDTFQSSTTAIWNDVKELSVGTVPASWTTGS